jgi:hypothetical protein
LSEAKLAVGGGGVGTGPAELVNLGEEMAGRAEFGGEEGERRELQPMHERLRLGEE